MLRAMYDQFERKLTEKEIKFLKTNIQAREKRNRSRYKAIIIQCLIGYGIAGVICLLGNLLSKDQPPFWFYMIIFWGAGTFLAFSLAKNAYRENMENSRMLSFLTDALQNGKARVEKIQSQRMLEVEELEDEGACYFFEVEARKLFQLYGQEYYSSATFPSTEFCLIDIIDSNGNPVASFLENNGEKLSPYRMICAKDTVKDLIPYDQKFIDCGIDEFEEYVKQKYA
jgi:hypothetical protein